jgi:hypothetical protein
MIIKNNLKISSLLLCTITLPVQAGEWTTEINFEMRHFLNKSATVQQYELETNPIQKREIADTGLAHQDEPSIAILPSYFNEWDGKKMHSHSNHFIVGMIGTTIALILISANWFRDLP